MTKPLSNLVSNLIYDIIQSKPNLFFKPLSNLMSNLISPVKHGLIIMNYQQVKAEVMIIINPLSQTSNLQAKAAIRCWNKWIL